MWTLGRLYQYRFLQAHLRFAIALRDFVTAASSPQVVKYLGSYGGRASVRRLSSWLSHLFEPSKPAEDPLNLLSSNGQALKLRDPARLTY